MENDSPRDSFVTKWRNHYCTRSRYTLIYPYSIEVSGISPLSKPALLTVAHVSHKL